MQNRSRIIGRLLIVLGAGIIGFLFFCCPSSLNDQKRNCFYVLCSNLLLYFFIWVFILSKGTTDALEPIIFVTIIYVLMFYITPIICLLTGDLLWFGLDLWAGCEKGTFYATAGYLFFLVAYYKHGRYISLYEIGEENDEEENEETEIIQTQEAKCFLLNLLFWIIGFVSSVILIISTGKSLVYIFTLADNSSTEIALSSNLLFLGTAAHMMLSSYLYILITSKSKVLKIILYYLMAMTYIIRGFRFILVAVIMAPIVLYYLRRNRRPHFPQVLLVLAGLLIMTSIIGMARVDIRNGIGIKKEIFSELSYESIKNVFINYFSIFKNYYGIIETFPEKMNYTMGQQMIFYTIIMLIPRAVWPGKPDPVNYQVVATAISDYARKAGSAPPNLAEFYHEFGFVGIMICMFLFGLFCKNLKRKMKNYDIHSRIAYSAIYPLLLQIVIRGYTPSNFYLILAVMIPIWATKGIIKSQRNQFGEFR